MSNDERFKEDHIPPKEAFFSKIHNADITNADFALAQSVWNAFHIHTLGEYLDLYLKSIILRISHYLHIALMESTIGMNAVYLI